MTGSLKAGLRVDDDYCPFFPSLLTINALTSSMDLLFDTILGILQAVV